MTHLSGAELFASLAIAVIGVTWGLKLFLDNAAKEKRKEWNFFIFGATAIVLVCGLFTPPDLFSNAIFSIPLIIVYRLVIWKIRGNNRENKLKYKNEV